MSDNNDTGLMRNDLMILGAGVVLVSILSGVLAYVYVESNRKLEQSQRELTETLEEMRAYLKESETTQEALTAERRRLEEQIAEIKFERIERDAPIESDEPADVALDRLLREREARDAAPNSQ